MANGAAFRYIRKSDRLPVLGTLSSDTVRVKLFCPWSNWTWYISEHDPVSGDCFGYVVGIHDELGYFNLRELEALRGPGGLRIERDIHWRPAPLSAVRDGSTR